MSNQVLKNLKIGKYIAFIANIVSGFLFFIAYTYTNNEVYWFLVAALINFAVALTVMIVFRRFEKRFEKYFKKD